MHNKEITVEGLPFRISLEKPVFRYPGNPLLCSSDVNRVWIRPEHQVVTVHNAGIARYDGRVIMLFRSHLRNGISVIGMAESHNGIDNWKIMPAPVLKPCASNDSFAPGVDPARQVENEAGGVEDPRISQIGDTYYITYSAYHGKVSDRVRVSMATTTDFRHYIRYGPLVDIDMRNVVLFPERIRGSYYALMRPNDHPEGAHIGGIFREIVLAETDSLTSNDWHIFESPVMRQTGGPSPFSHKIGPGAPPVHTKYGWLSIFHGVRSTMDGNPYVLGVAFHDTDDPLRVAVSNIPILFPNRADCRVAEDEYIHVPQVVFCCGALRREDGTIMIYYGGNDTVMNLAFSHEDILHELVTRFPQDPLTGVPTYNY